MKHLIFFFFIQIRIVRPVKLSLNQIKDPIRLHLNTIYRSFCKIIQMMNALKVDMPLIRMLLTIPRQNPIMQMLKPHILCRITQF